MDAHIFIDNSNAFGGAQRASSKEEPEAIWLAVRIYYKNFFKLIEKGYRAKTKVLAGSVPPGNDVLWDHARATGYNTDLLRKIESDDGRLIEQGVDEIAHLKIANALLDHEPPQTLVLVTGDGNNSDFGTSFTQQAQRALRQGWNVVVWSWKDQLSGKFSRLAEKSAGKMQVNIFDPHYKQITFVQGGTYDVSGSTVNVSGRVVSRLDI
ncbi:NYN domain-containing protein [Pseudomonas benzenivorans]|uniref:NYN domain-containing protein n=1 Tax=Pseudomonas benzenivorans TaxID=556533 RepID=UPI00351805E5